ncbi:MAG: hypothetical protein KDB32_11595 [Planctomycetes bacterium]|nr:hypothetical protein [Planctomycetota bacterium]
MRLLLLMLTFCTPLFAEPEAGVNFVESEPLYAGGLQLYGAHRHSFATRTFDDFRPVPNRDSLFSSAHTLGLGVNYSIPRVVPGDWTLSAVIPLTWREFRTRVNDRVITDRVHGLADISLGARARYLWWVPGDSSQQGSSLSIALITDLPTGQSSAKTEGKEVPADLQLGHGSFDFTLVHIGSYSSNRMELIHHASFEWRSAGIGGSDYDFGDVFSVDFEFKYRVIQEKFPGNTMFLMVALEYTHADYDRDDGHRVTNTGYQQLAVQPKIQWHPRPWWEFKGVFNIPVYRNGHGIQLVDELSFRFSIAWRFAT